MEINTISSMSHKELMDCISKRKNEIAEKIKNGETEPTFAIGAQSFTNKEWDNLIKKVDKNLEAIKEEQEQRKEAYEKEQKQLLRNITILESKGAKCHYFMDKMNGTYKKPYPYDYLAEDDMITYNGVVFTCSADKNAICLGDVSDRRNVLTIPLAEGGNLMVNRDNLGELSNAMSMFSPEDVNRIMRAIADDKKAQEELQTIEEETNSLGDSAEENFDDTSYENAMLDALLRDREDI